MKQTQNPERPTKLTVNGITFRIVYAGERAFIICTLCNHHAKKSESPGVKTCQCLCHMPSVLMAEELLNL